MGNAHTKIIASTAKTALAPLGFRRQGQSRLWLKDHEYWLNIVGFKPSRWSVAVDLDNAAHWLWAGAGFMSLNYSLGGPHVAFESEEQFVFAIGEVANQAAEKAQEIDERFSSFEKIAMYVISEHGIQIECDQVGLAITRALLPGLWVNFKKQRCF